jgi:hypothetical protein
MKYGINIIKTSIISFLKINVSIFFSTLIFFVFSVNLFVNNFYELKINNESISIWYSLFKIITIRPISIIITFVVVILSPILAFKLGNKYIINKISLTILDNSKENFIFPILDKIFYNIQKNNPKLLELGIETIELKSKLIEEIKNSNNNKWMKRLVINEIQKLKLDKIKNNYEEINLKELITNKIFDNLKITPKPSKKFIFFIILAQFFFIFYLK